MIILKRVCCWQALQLLRRIEIGATVQLTISKRCDNPVDDDNGSNVSDHDAEQTAAGVALLSAEPDSAADIGTGIPTSSPSRNIFHTLIYLVLLISIILKTTYQCCTFGR